MGTTSRSQFSVPTSEESPSSPTNGKISVIHLIHSMAYGGVDAIVIDWLRTIDRDRFEPHLVCFANPHETERPFVDAALREGLEVEKIGWSRLKPILKSARELAALVSKYDAKIIHTHNVYADVVGVIAAKMTGAKSIATLYVWGDFGFKRNMLQHVDRMALQFFDRITTQCQMTYDQTIERGLPAGRTSVLSSGFEVNELATDQIERDRKRRELGAAEGDIVLVNVARFYPEKAQDLLLRCFRKIVDARSQARLWILGVGPLEAELKAQCRELNLDDNVRFLGFRDDLGNFLRLTDIQVHPSHNEGVPIALCAGMEAGLPVVATAVGGIPEILVDGRNGVLVPVADEAAFIAAVIDLIDDPEKLGRMGRESRRFIEEEYSLAASVRKLEKLYMEMIAK